MHDEAPSIQRVLPSFGKPVSAEPLSSTHKPREQIPVNNVQTTYSDVEKVLSQNRKNGSTSGTAPPKIDKYYLTDYNAVPGLAHVNITLSSLDHTQAEAKVHVLALHDSGCAKTIISQKIFDKLLAQGHIEIKQPERPTVIVSCTGEAKSITGLADILLHFEGINNVKKSFELNVIVHSGITQDFLLGRDFTGSDARAFETNRFLFLTNELDTYNESIRKALDNKNLCQVPIIGSGIRPMHVAANNITVIAPYSDANIIGTLAKDPEKIYQLPLTTREMGTYIVKNGTLPGLKVLPWVMNYLKPNEVVIPVYNNTHQDMIIERNTLFADIELVEKLDEEYEVHSMSMQEVSEDVYACNTSTPAFQDPDVIPCNLARPDFIEDDQGMNEEEKQTAFMHYMKHGYHHPSMTKEVEERAALTELYLQDVTPFDDNEFEKQFDLAHIPLKQRTWAMQMFRRRRDVFSRHACDLGCARDIEMKIEPISDVPHIQKYTPLAHAVREQVRAILDQMIEYGIIRECDEPSPFCSNLLVVKKKDGKTIRILLDGRLLNNQTRRLPTNLVTHLELYAHLANAEWVTTIDLSDAFFQIPLEKASQKYTVFYSEAHGKRYCFQRCPQGLKNSPLHLKLLMDKYLGDMAKDVIHYADDIMLATYGTLQQHLRRLEEVLARLEKAGVKIRPSKINVARDTVDFLGVVWTKGKISIPEAKVLAFKTLPSPNTPKRTKSVICALAYYRKFIPKFAEISQPLMDLTVLHPKQFKWTDDHEKRFRLLIDTIIQNSSLHLPDPTKEFFVQTDASQNCGAGRVFQKDKDGNELLIACVSRTFTKSERVYSTVKKEVLALLYTLRTMDFFLRYAPKLVILVDAQAILFLRMCKDSQGILLRFSLELSKYDAEVHHVPGVNNEVVDVLSRQHDGIEDIMREAKVSRPLTEEQTLQILKRLCIREGHVFSREEVATLLELDSLPNPVDKKRKQSTAKMGERTIKNTPQMLSQRKIKLPKESFKRPGVILPQREKRSRLDTFDNPAIECNTAQCQTEECNTTDTMSYSDFKTSSKAILRGILSKEDFKEAQQNDEYCLKILNSTRHHLNFVLIEGLLYSKRQNRLRLVLPVALLDIVINAKHFSVFGLHFSRTRIQRDISSRYHVQMSVLNKRLKRLKNNCLVCQFNSSEKEDHELRQSDYVYAPRVTWGVDLIPNMPLSNDNQKVALLAVDLFTGYIQICPMKDRTSQELIKAIETTIIRPFGAPKFIRSDNEPGLFNSKEFYDYLQPRGTQFLPTSVGSPWANSTAERSVRTIKDAARNFLFQEKAEKDWEHYVDYFTAAHNQSTSVYGFAPEELMFGYTKPNVNDLLQFWPNTASHSDYIEKIIPIAEKNRELSNKRAESKRLKNRTYKNADRVQKTFQLGQIVAHRQLQVATGSAMSMKPRFTGPYVIEELLPDKSSAIIEHLHTGHVMKAHYSNIKSINYHPAGNRVHAKFDEDLEKSINKTDTTSITDNTDLSQMLSQRNDLPSITVRQVNPPGWENNTEDRLRARFVDSEGEEIEFDPPEEVLSTQTETPSSENAPLLFGELQDELDFESQLEEYSSNTTTISKEELLKLILDIEEFKCKYATYSCSQFYKNNGFHKTLSTSDDDEDLMQISDAEEQMSETASTTTTKSPSDLKFPMDHEEAE